MKGQPRRNWTEARAKVEESGCIIGRGCEGPLETAHLIGRERDRYTLDGTRHCLSVWPVEPLRVVGLCRRHHMLFDAHGLDLLGHLHVTEEAQAVLDAGSLELARVRLAPSAYERKAA